MPSEEVVSSGVSEVVTSDVVVPSGAGEVVPSGVFEVVPSGASDDPVLLPPGGDDGDDGDDNSCAVTSDEDTDVPLEGVVSRSTYKCKDCPDLIKSSTDTSKGDDRLEISRINE